MENEIKGVDILKDKEGIIYDEDGWPKVPNVVESESKRFYNIPPNRKYPSDLYLHVHRSGIAAIGLAAGHVVRSQNLKVKRVRFADSDDASKAIQVSGKRKRGAPKTYPGSFICDIECEDGSIFGVRGMTIGKLVETNSQLVQNPMLLQSDPEFSGYLAVVMLNHNQLDAFAPYLIPYTDYMNLLPQRVELGKMYTGNIIDFGGETGPTTNDTNSNLGEREAEGIETSTSRNGDMQTQHEITSSHTSTQMGDGE